ncbi:MAG: YbhN family protein [Eubacteriales bacterium]|nr:YbhN family protein [Eubacteriales bacterium]
MTDTQKHSRARIRNTVSTVLFVILLGLLAWYVYEHREEMRKLLSLSPDTVLLLLALGLASCVVNCFYHREILKTYQLKLSLTDWAGVVCVTDSIAYVLPMRADLVFSATYYKRVKGLAYTQSIAITAGNAVFGVAFSLLQILLALLCMGFIDGAWPITLWTLLAVGAAGLTFFLWLSLHAESRLRLKLEKVKLVKDVIVGFNALLRNRTLLWRLLVCMIASNLIRLFINMVCFQAVGLPITLYEALFYSSVSWLASVVAIVPGNVGLRESVMGAASLALGALFSEGVAATLLNRVAVMVVYFLMGLIFAVPVMRNFNRSKGQLDRNEEPLGNEILQAERQSLPEGDDTESKPGDGTPNAPFPRVSGE